MQKTAVHTAPTAASVSWGWMLLALGSHTGWGVYPVLARYLQTVAGLPSMAMLLVANMIALAIVGTVVWRRGEIVTLRAPVLWGVALLAMLRSVTNVLSARYTPAIYVQLTNLLTPFLVVGIGALVFRESIPRRTLPALGLTLVGALALMSGDVASAGRLVFALGLREWFGVGLALFSSLALALYMLAVRSTRKHPVSGEATFAIQLVVLVLTSGLLSAVFQEDWSRWQSLDMSGWLAFLAFALPIVLGSNLTQIHALRHLGAPLVSSMQAWRLVATLLIGGLVLAEWLSTPLQIGGALLVVVTVSWYLWSQRTR